MSQSSYGVYERRKDPDKICYNLELMGNQSKYKKQLENSCFGLTQSDGWTARGLAWDRADCAEEKTLTSAADIADWKA